MEQLTNNRIDLVNVAIVALIGFVIGIIIGYVLFGVPSIYGLESMPQEYYQIIAITENATNQTEGNMIDMYIGSIKADICPTIVNNETALKECYEL